VDNLAWLLSGEHWCHDGTHACEILVTTNANKTLSMDLLTLLKKCATSHKTQSTIDAAQSFLSEEIQGVNDMELIKKGLGFELFQKRVKTAFCRGLGSETVDAMWTYVHATQKSGETVGAFFKRVSQQYALVQLTDGCDFGDVTRKTLALQGLKHGSYQEVLGPWVHKVLMKSRETQARNSYHGRAPVGCHGFTHLE
jgi:hypothetical protein